MHDEPRHGSSRLGACVRRSEQLPDGSPDFSNLSKNELVRAILAADSVVLWRATKRPPSAKQLRGLINNPNEKERLLCWLSRVTTNPHVCDKAESKGQVDFKAERPQSDSVRQHAAGTVAKGDKLVLI